MRKSVLPIAIAAATMAMASAFLSTTPAGGETKTLESVALADANWAVLGKPAAPVVNGASGYCLGVQGTAATAGALIAGRHCAGDPAQAWSVRASVTTAAGRAATLTWSQLRNGGSGMCLDVRGGAAAGARLVQARCGGTGDAAQFWRFVPRGAAHELVNRKSRLCAGIPASPPGSGAGAVLLACSGGPAQAWSRAAPAGA